MRHGARGMLILSVIGVGSAFAQTSTLKTNPPTVNDPAKPATPDDRRADVPVPRDGVITPAPGTSSDTGTTGGVVQNLPIPGNARAPKPPSCEGRISSVGWKVVLLREAASLAGSGPLGLKRSESQQGEPMRMVLTRH
jgi:hypothetical protein